MLLNLFRNQEEKEKKKQHPINESTIKFITGNVSRSLFEFHLRLYQEFLTYGLIVFIIT